MVLAQYYNFVRYGDDGYSYIMRTMQANAHKLAAEIEAIGAFEIIGAENAEQLPLVAFRLAAEHSYDEFDISAQLATDQHRAGRLSHRLHGVHSLRTRHDKAGNLVRRGEDPHGERGKDRRCRDPRRDGPVGGLFERDQGGDQHHPGQAHHSQREQGSHQRP